MLSPTLTNSHSPVLKEAQTFSSPPCPLLGPSVPAGTPAERESTVSPAHTPPFPFWTSGCPSAGSTYTFPDSCSISSHCACSNSDSAASKMFPCQEEGPRCT